MGCGSSTPKAPAGGEAKPEAKPPAKPSAAAEPPAKPSAAAEVTDPPNAKPPDPLKPPDSLKQIANAAPPPSALIGEPAPVDPTPDVRRPKPRKGRSMVDEIASAAFHTLMLLPIKPGSEDAIVEMARGDANAKISAMHGLTHIEIFRRGPPLASRWSLLHRTMLAYTCTPPAPLRCTAPRST